MTTASVTILKAKLSEYLGRVKRGDEVSVTDRGREVARLVPSADPTAGADSGYARLVRAGLIRPGRKGGLRPSLRTAPRHRDPGGFVLKALLEDRGE